MLTHNRVASSPGWSISLVLGTNAVSWSIPVTSWILFVLWPTDRVYRRDGEEILCFLPYWITRLRFRWHSRLRSPAYVGGKWISRLAVDFHYRRLRRFQLTKGLLEPRMLTNIPVDMHRRCSGLSFPIILSRQSKLEVHPVPDTGREAIGHRAREPRQRRCGPRKVHSQEMARRRS